MDLIDFEREAKVQRWIQREMKRLRYGLYKATCLADNGESVQRHFIVLRDQYGIIVHWTRLGQFVGLHRDLLRPIARDNAKHFSFVVQMLNYFLCSAGTEHHVGSLAEITRQQLAYYFMDYAHTPSRMTGDYRSAESVAECVFACTAFLSNLRKEWPEMQLTQNDLWKEKTIMKNTSGPTKARKREVVQVPNFEVTTFACKQNQIFRDIPNFVLERMFALAAQHLPQLVMPMALGVFAGLRPGECCQVRQERVGGLQIMEAAGMVMSITIDLNMDKPMRSDGIVTGNIKKYRTQRVYPGFLPQFQQVLQFQMQYLSEHGFEPEFSPLVIGPNGKAMTVRTYRWTFQQLVERYLRPSLLTDPDPRCQQYGQMLLRGKLAPHAMRHCFSVALVLAGENATQLQYYRGDSSPDSSYVYLTNKTELMERYQQITEDLLADLLEKGEEDARAICVDS